MSEETEKKLSLHDLRPAPGSSKERKRVGRGNAGKGGTYAGRGRKGQGARSGGGKGPYFEGGQLPLVRRLPRKRGFTNIFRVEFRIINVGRLEEVFGAGDEITPATLLEKGLIKKGKTPVKVLAQGDLSKPLTIQAHAFSQGAKDKISAAGGSAVVLDQEAEAEAAAPAEKEVPAQPRATAATRAAAKAATPDDLKRIEGIGPTIEGTLHDNGITSFAQLAEATPEALSEMLSGVGGSHDPTTWPEQAALAAAGKWDALQEMQDELKGGRRE